MTWPAMEYESEWSVECEVECVSTCLKEYVMEYPPDYLEEYGAESTQKLMESAAHSCSCSSSSAMHANHNTRSINNSSSTSIIARRWRSTWGLLLLVLLLFVHPWPSSAGSDSREQEFTGLQEGPLSGTHMGNHNGVRCPWACNCGGQELDCANRALTQVPGNLAALTLAEKL
ncbi:hypothetical protein QAD02_018123, partial [Eretmocerus hayati]